MGSVDSELMAELGTAWSRRAARQQGNLQWCVGNPVDIGMTERIYTNGEINVHWKSELCIHCGNCMDGLPAVFNPDLRPWVNLSNATTDEIREQVSKCPSGALMTTEE